SRGNKPTISKKEKRTDRLEVMESCGAHAAGIRGFDEIILHRRVHLERTFIRHPPNRQGIGIAVITEGGIEDPGRSQPYAIICSARRQDLLQQGGVERIIPPLPTALQ